MKLHERMILKKLWLESNITSKNNKLWEKKAKFKYLEIKLANSCNAKF